MFQSTKKTFHNPMIYYLFITLIYYAINSSVLFFILGNQTSEILFRLILYVPLIWIFIFVTDFFPRITYKRTFYHFLDDYFENLNRYKFVPRFSLFLRTRRGSPIKYFVLIFFVSILLSAFLLNILGYSFLIEILAICYFASITFFSNYPAYLYSRKFIAKRLNPDLVPDHY